MIRPDPHDRSVARRVLLTGLALGLLAEMALDGPALGVNVPVLVAAVLAVGWFVRRPGRALDPLDAWLPIGAIVLALLVAVRGDPFLGALDTIITVALLGASLAAMSGLAVTRRSASVIATMGAWGLEGVLVGAARAIDRTKPTRDLRIDHAPAWVAPVGRGLIIGVPLGLIFVVLFASADPIFRNTIADLLGFRVDLGDLPGRALFTLAAGWFLAGAISISATGLPDLERSSLGAAARSGPLTLARWLGLPEALVILAVIDLVVGAFVGLQVAYLFGGLDTLQAAGITYAEYARRGFFELVAAACLASSVVVVLEAMVVRRTRVYVAALAALVALTALVLISAAVRLGLYQAAYGWTELRLYVLAAIVAMGAGLVVMMGLVLSDLSRWLGHMFAVLGLVALVGLNLMAPASFVAGRNIERVLDPSMVPADGHSGLDAEYLAVLPDDAIPVMVEALPRLPTREASEVLALLRQRRSDLGSDPAYGSLFSWNLGRERARSALSNVP
jgi:Domain of unknown function (DUF4173)